MSQVHALPTGYVEADPVLDGAVPDDLVDELGVHEPLLTFPAAPGEEPDWPAALDALIAAKLFQGH
jgi:hypothetical protein